MKCKFIKTDDELIKICSVCGRQVKTKSSPENIDANCKANPDFKPINFGEKLYNFANSMIDFASDGFSLASEELGKKRMEICESCDLFKDKTCSLCGCNMPMKVKIASSQCPLKNDEFPNGKWPIH